MPILATLASWALNGGWKWLLAGLGATVAGVFLWGWIAHYHALQAAAARVPALEATISEREARIGQMEHAEADRDVADKALSTWQDAKTDILKALRKGMANAPIATNPDCAPRDADRRLRNEAFDKLLPLSQPAVPAQ